MKILMLTEEQDIFYHFLLEALNGLNFPLAHAQYPLSQEEMRKFDPDIIIHNIKDVAKIEYKNVITIAINESDADNCFSYKNPEAKNFIRPFVKTTKDDLNNKKYKSDVVYVGNPALLPDCTVEIQNDPNINFKLLNNSPVPVKDYCGSCTFGDYKKFFKMSKCSLLNAEDSNPDIYSFKLLDIIYSEGNPIIYRNEDQFLNDIKEAVNGKCFRDNFMSQEEVKKHHTNYSRMSEIFSKIGLSKMSKMIADNKGI